ncbi:anti-sigma-I factor RsgI6-like [Watersipora subatra]|uniref:anti-sigma-I factor RsgI6-like n=1 Tax=Watersipora subatra TaxID=2589382 RepID=UPI00355C3155
MAAVDSFTRHLATAISRVSKPHMSFWFCISGLLLLASLDCLAIQQLLKNANLEQPISSQNWKCFNCKVFSVTDAHGGQEALLSAYRTAKYAGPGQTLDLSKVKPGHHYQFKSFVKIDPAIKLTSSQKIIATIRHSFTDGSKDEYQTLASIPDVRLNTWLPVNADFILKDFKKHLKELYLYIEGPVPGVNIVLDDTSLTELDNSGTWRTEAAKRIEAIRKGDLTITFQSDAPLSNVEVKLEQLNHEFGFGTAVAADFLQTNTNYRNWYLNNFEWAVLENALKWRQVEWTRGHFKWAPVDGALKILEDNGKKVRGHTIFWAVKARNPEWVQKITDKTELHQVCMKRATDVVSRYKGRLQHWDVNNEMMAGSFFKDTYGSSKIRYDMFTKAKEVDPNVKLFLNDYNVISGGGRLYTYINMIREFVAAKAPVSGIGVQGHFSARPEGPILLNRLDELAKLNLPIWITELDYTVKDNQQRADGLEDALTAFFSHPSVDGVLFWGYYDGRHWRGKDAALVNGPNMTPNAAGKMWQRLFHNEWRSNIVKKVGTVPPGRDVSVSERVFYGKYKVTTSINGQTYSTRYVTINKSQGKKTLRIPLAEPVIG